MNSRVLTWGAAVFLAALPTVQATNFAILLGGSIAGESVDMTLPGWIDVDALSIDGPLSGTFVFHKRIDKSTPKLMEACAQNRFIRTGILIGNIPGDPPRQLMKIELRDILITGIKQDQPGPGVEAGESITMKISGAHYSYYESSGTASTAYLPPTGDTDSDQDGIPDEVERHYGLNPALNDSSLDNDNDGLSNLTEIKLGFNPSAGDSSFRADVKPVPADLNAVDVGWEAVPGKAYVIEWSPDLSVPFSIVTTHTPDGTQASVRLTKSGLKGFFRVRPSRL